MSETKAPYGEPQRARLTRQGQITVPKAVREALGARPGDDLLFEQRGEEIVLRHRPRKSILDFAGIAAGSGAPGWLTQDAIDTAIEEAVYESYLAKEKRIAASRQEP